MNGASNTGVVQVDCRAVFELQGRLSGLLFASSAGAHPHG